MTRTLRLSTLAAAAALAALTGTAAAENLEIRMATLAPAGSKWMEGLDKAAAELDKIVPQAIAAKDPAGAALAAFTLGQIHFQRGDWKKAETSLDVFASELAGEETYGCFGLGSLVLAQVRTGNLAAAEKNFAKLAAQCVRQHGAASVGLITLDTYRVSGYEQLRAYGRMLGVVAHLAHDRAALKDLLDLLSNKRMVIIDTAGLGQRDQRIQEMLDVLDMPSVKKVLVLNAGSHGDTLDDVLTSFKSSGLHGVVLSKVDEAVKLGPAIDALVRHQVVLRGVANGQRVPEDWQNPDAATLVRVAMGTEGKSAYDPVATDMGFYFSQASSRGIQLGAGHV